MIDIDCQGLEVPDHPVKRLTTFSLCLACILPLSGCWNGGILFAFERPFWDSIGGNAGLTLALSGECAVRGYLPRVLVTGPQESPVERLGREVATGRYRTVVVGPLLSFEWKGYAPRYPRTRFVLIGGDRGEDLPPNVVLLRYDRANAYRAAGFAAGLSVRGKAAGGKAAGGKAAGGDAGGLGPRIGVLLSSSPELTAEETEAFSAGAAEALSGARPVVRVVAEPAEKPAVTTAVTQMHKEGVEVFLFGMGNLDAWCLEVLQTTGGCAVVADWAASAAFPEQVFLSIEEDIRGGILRVLAVAGPGMSAVSGPVRIVNGKARPLPEEARTRREGG